MINTNKKAYFIYVIASIILIIFSCFGIIFNRFEPIIVLSINLIFGGLVLFINLKDQDKTYEETSPSLMSYMLNGFLRVLSYGFGLILSGICIYYLNLNGEKIRFIIYY